MEAGKKAAGEVLALQKRVLAVLNEARYDVVCLYISVFSVLARNIKKYTACACQDPAESMSLEEFYEWVFL